MSRMNTEMVKWDFFYFYFAVKEQIQKDGKGYNTYVCMY